ncbi:zinc-dependent peptidase [Arenimonas fontis]|uniref:Zinc-dependent peptidase n=2 Tax=Arenimonas fontis TaxID=2608255 RepID=A0A5B2ZEB8_9GAMM|nr:M90 family metallopeptidase [Arenimonas fontis]KAA2285412.1 zinc-dependent peptidase [Arenimonas fontis]
MFSLLRHFRSRPAPELPADRAADLARDLPWLARLRPERRQRLLALTARFLAEKTITPVQGLSLSPRQQAMIAALGCLPLIEFGAEGLHGWSQVLVYPGAFRAHRSHHDADTGVVTEWEDELSGEAWEQGPLVLSWDDLLADLAEPEAGYQLAVHEMAHKLDALDGAMDGTPPLPAAWQRQWARDFQAAYDSFRARVQAGEETAMDAYAAEAPEEFFAVASEYHFSAPALLSAEMPAVADHLLRLYGPSPIPGGKETQ